MQVQATVVESFSRAPRPKKINDVLRLEYRAKLLNPKYSPPPTQSTDHLHTFNTL